MLGSVQIRIYDQVFWLIIPQRRQLAGLIGSDIIPANLLSDFLMTPLINMIYALKIVIPCWNVSCALRADLAVGQGGRVLGRGAQAPYRH